MELSSGELDIVEMEVEVKLEIENGNGIGTHKSKSHVVEQRRAERDPCSMQAVTTVFLISFY